MTLPTSGWENPDNHEPLEARPRPMFDAKGRPVTEAPPPDPAPELDAFLRPGDIQPAVPIRPDYAAGAVVKDGERVQGDLTGGPHGEVWRKVQVIAERLDNPSYLQYGIPGDGVRQLIQDLHEALA